MKIWIEGVKEKEQRNRLKELANIISPVPVVFVDSLGGSIERPERGFYYPGGIANALVVKHGFVVKFLPVFYIAKIGDRFNRPHIKIWNGLSYYSRVGTLLHETGHALCHKENCECCRKDRMYREIHANEHALNWILKYKLNKVLTEEVWFILKLSEQNNYHGKAARHTMKSGLWQKCMSLYLTRNL